MNGLQVFAVAASLMGLAGAASTPARPIAVVQYQRNGKLVLVPVTINGRALRFTLDSGALRTILDPSAAASLRLTAVSSGRTSGVGMGAVALHQAGALTVFVGRAPLHVPAPWIIDLTNAGTELPQNGLLGEDLLARYVVRIDPILRTIALYDPVPFRYDGSGAAIPLSVIRNRLYIPMKLSVARGIAAVRSVRIDTGSEDAVADDLVKQSPERRKSVQGVGLGQPYVDYSGVLERVQIGPYVIRHSWGPSSRYPTVGMEILRRFTMTIDVPHHVLYLEANHWFADSVPSPAAASH